MEKLGFNGKWICWVMECVKTVKLSVLLNGQMLDSFTPSRGLRQGDPLSPYIFLLVADGLSTILNKEISTGQLKELHISRNAPGISHLLFADDSVLFVEANAEQALLVKNILSTYEKSTGQLISKNKCSVLFGRNCSEDNIETVNHCWETLNRKADEKYLGLPVPEGRMDEGKFRSLKERFSKHANDWSEKYLSSGAKEVLVKSVLQNLPTYAMSVFKFSAGLCDELEQLIRNFWWGDEHDRRKIHWLA
jgi:hypothetical protein